MDHAEVQPLMVQPRCSFRVPRLSACHGATAYALQDSDIPPNSVAPGRSNHHAALECSGTTRSCKNRFFLLAAPAGTANQDGSLTVVRPARGWRRGCSRPWCACPVKKRDTLEWGTPRGSGRQMGCPSMLAWHLCHGKGRGTCPNLGYQSRL